MNHAIDLLHSFEQHYSLKDDKREYTLYQKQELADAYSWISQRYKIALYEEVCRAFEASQRRPLPDMAALKKAETNLPPRLDPPAEDTQPLLEDNRTFEEIQAEVREKAKIEGETNHVNRQRWRKRVANGDASRDEAYRIWCIDVHGGNWMEANKHKDELDAWVQSQRRDKRATA